MQIHSFSDYHSQELPSAKGRKSAPSLEFLDETFQSSKTCDGKKRNTLATEATLSSYNALYDTPVKIIIVGDSSVGKSSIIKRYINNEFDEKSNSTIGIAYNSKKVQVKSNSPFIFDSSVDQSVSFGNMNLNIWDTAGGERFRALTHLFFNGAKGVLFVMDISQRKSFLNLKYWIDQVQSNLDENVVKCLFCNKSDTKTREVATSEIAALCEQWNINYFEGSAKTGLNIENAFNFIAEEIHENITVSLNRIVSLRNLDMEPSTIKKKFNFFPTSKEALLMKLDSKDDKRDGVKKSQIKCGC